MKSLGAAAAVAFVLAMAQGAQANSMLKYAVTFEGSCSMATHPLEFPVRSSAPDDAVVPSANPG